MVDVSKLGARMKPLTFTVEAGKIREFARAIRDDNPVYHGERPPAPLTFLRTFLNHGDNLQDSFAEIGVDIRRILHGGQEFEYLEPVLAGDVLTVTATFTDYYTKPGKRGGMLEFVIYEWVFTNQHGRVAARSTNTTIQTSRAAISS
jgi:hypothetical protein